MATNRQMGRAVTALTAIAATGVAWAAFAGPALAQTQTHTEEAKGDDHCAALHLVLVNGTFDTSAQQDSRVDHGFGAQIAGPAMEQANDGPVSDPSAGISLEDAKGNLTAAPVTTAPTGAGTAAPFGNSTSTKPTGSEVVGNLGDLQNQLWGDSGKSGVTTPTSKANSAWDNTAASSTTATTAQSAPSSSSERPTSEANSAWETKSEPAEMDEKHGIKIARTYITYPAAAGGAFIPGLPTSESVSYDDSMREGALNTGAVLKEIADECPNTKILLAGHSQGAQVVSLVAREIGNGVGDFDPSRIAGVALFSDPTREAGSPTMVSGDSAPEPVPGTSGQNVAQVGSFASRDAAELDGGGMGVNTSGGKDFGALSGRTASWCVPGDLVCDLPISGPLSELVISAATQLDLSDPEKSLQAVADTLNPAVIMGGVEDIKGDEFSYGANGFSASGKQAREDSSLIGSISSSGVKQAAAQNSTQGGIVTDLGESVIQSVNKIGGMALGTGISILKEAVTPANLAQVAMAGVAGPEAALGVAATKLTDASLKVLTPETAVGMADEVFKSVDVLGISGKGLAQVAVEAAGHGAAHNSYGTRPVTEDGRTPIEATIDWAVAASNDITGETAPARQSGGSAGTSSVSQLSSTFNTDLARKALSEVQAWRAQGGA